MRKMSALATNAARTTVWRLCAKIEASDLFDTSPPPEEKYTGGILHTLVAASQP